MAARVEKQPPLRPSVRRRHHTENAKELEAFPDASRAVKEMIKSVRNAPTANARYAGGGDGIGHTRRSMRSRDKMPSVDATISDA